jgi:hypothetical protein
VVLSTRPAAAAAVLQRPPIYRLFGDKDGLLEADPNDILGNDVNHTRQLMIGMREIVVAAIWLVEATAALVAFGRAETITAPWMVTAARRTSVTVFRIPARLIDGAGVRDGHRYA